MQVVVSTYTNPLSYLTLDEAKHQLRIKSDVHDVEITALIKAAVKVLNSRLGYPVNGEVVKVYSDSLTNSFQYKTITEVAYQETKGNYTAYTGFDTVKHPHKVTIIPTGDDSFYDYGYKYEISITQGFDSGSFPDDLKHALKMILHDLWMQRGDQTPITMRVLPHGIESLIVNHAWRVFR